MFRAECGDDEHSAFGVKASEGDEVFELFLFLF